MSLNMSLNKIKTIKCEIRDIRINICLTYSPDGTASGSIESNLMRGFKEKDDLSVALSAVESMILAHACAGVEVNSQRYLEGLSTAIDAIANQNA